jgi:predicted phosphodiesterase
MRYAFISDLHANLQAWHAVHRDIRNQCADYIICLGDVVGYGPSPARLLNEVHSHIDAFVLGNHDAVVAGKMDDSSFNPEAREIIRWTAGRLNRKASEFLGSFPLTLIGNGFRCAHGDFSKPANFEYVLNPEDALPSWQTVDTQLLLAGHTHDPAFFLIGASGIPREIEPQDFELEPGKRYFVNVGSVGAPRDGDPRASYCLYDTEARAVFWRRVAFDLDSYRSAIIQSGLDVNQCHFLKNDPLEKTIPVREQLDFTPPTLPGKAAQTPLATRDFTLLKRNLRRWKQLFFATTAAGVLACASAVWLWSGHKSHKRTTRLRSPQITAPVKPEASTTKPKSRKRKSTSPAPDQSGLRRESSSGL